MTTDGPVAAMSRVSGALALWAVGGIHLQQYLERYSAVPTIGTLFVLNFIGATVVGLGLLLPIERLVGRAGGPLVVLLALAGIGQAATAFVMLAISEHRPLFGFQEPGYDPTAIANARATELAAVVLLTASLAARFSTKAPKARW